LAYISCEELGLEEPALKYLTVIWLSLCLLLSACSQQATPSTTLPEVTETETVENVSNDAELQAEKDEQLSEADNVEENDAQTDSLQEQAEPSVQTEPDEYDYVLEFPSDSYPETAMHIFSAIENGHSDVCTIDRNGADERRKQSLKGISTRDGYDRDEWPMAMCAEGGAGASVAYVDSSDNRGAGSWVGHQLSAYEDGEKILFIVAKPASLFGKPNPNSSKQELKLDEDLQAAEEVYYNNCTEAHEAGVTPLFEGDPGYSKKLDRDGDGVACEL